MTDITEYTTQGIQYCQQGQYAQAVTCFRTGLSHNPQDLTTRINLAHALALQEYLNEAAPLYTELAHETGEAHLYENAIIAWLKANERDLALAMSLRATQHLPQHPQAHYLLGYCHEQKGEMNQAMHAYQKALNLDSQHVEARHALAHLYHGLALEYKKKHQLDQAIIHYDQAIHLCPERAQYHWNQGLAYLTGGQFTQAWSKFPYRKLLDSPTIPPSTGASAWDGQDFPGKSLLIRHEQGLGDSLQYIRYVPWVKAQGGTVIVEAPPALLQLYQSIAEVDAWIPAVTGQMPTIEHDLETYLMDLPGLFQSTEATLPATVPYLSPPPDKRSAWESRFPSQGFKIGIAWAGSPGQANDKTRSCQLARFKDLQSIPGTHWYSLQKGPRSLDLKTADMDNIEDLSPELNDFIDTAAIMEQLDLIITVDTAVLHLAGALGVTTWGLLSDVPSSRWMYKRSDSPWYPTLKLYRQSNLQHWDPVFQAVYRDLSSLVQRVIGGIVA